MNIFFESKSVTKVEESAKVSVSDLLSDLGGACSLYLGISVIALFELVEFGFRSGAKAMSKIVGNPR